MVHTGGTMSDDRTKSLLVIDPLLMLAVIGLIAVGILFIFSSGVNSNGVIVSAEYIRQILWAIGAVIVLISFSYLNYNILRDVSFWIYVALIALLILTLLVGKVVNGAKSWIGILGLGGQPSEFAKIATVLFLARFLQNHQQDLKDWKIFAQGFLIVLIPMGLILKQPDTGTTLVFLPMYFIMVFLAGGALRHILYLGAIGILGIILALIPAVETIVYHESAGFGSLLTDIRTLGILAAILFVILVLSLIGQRRYKQRLYYWITYTVSILLAALVMGYVLRMVLKDYQVMRFIVFLDPSVDPKGSGWNLIQSMTAIGSGGWGGKGFLAGTQSHYRFLPMQSTDFIFSILGEEWGFVGGLVVFGLFALLLFRLLAIMNSLKDTYGVLVIAGIIAIFFTHVVVNIGMTIGIMPVTGIPLYFLSYGGSSIISGSLAVGIAMNIHYRRFRF